MGFVLTEDQELIRKTARSFVQAQLPVTHLRKLRDEKDATGFSRSAWRELAANGLVGAALPESDGGGGLGYAELGLVLEECGRTLAPTPFLSTVLLSANAVALAGTPEQRAQVLPGIAQGERVIAFAHEEGTRFRRWPIQTKATPTADGFRIVGDKSFVLDGNVADSIIVVARTSGADDSQEGLTFFLVPRGVPGLGIQRRVDIDSRNAARVIFDRVDVPASAIIGEAGRAGLILDQVLDRATAGLCAEMLGGALEAFDRTLAYLKVRKQFGVPIGSFQALKHRAAWMFAELELSKSIVAAALRAIDANSPDVPTLVSTAKARMNETAILVASEAIQMHGGIGATDELDIGLFYKRAHVAAQTFGNAAYHRDRFARLSGY
jgi:alkylation response protein AidB-like acyl-CoA dehydrogenase